MAILRSSSKGFVLLECVLAMGLFCLLAMLLSKALAFFMQQWFLHEQSWQRLRQEIHIAADLDGWLHSLQQACTTQCGCDSSNKAIYVGYLEDPVIGSENDNRHNMLQILTCDHEDLVWAKLFVAPYRGVAGEDWGLYTKLGDHPRLLLVNHATKLQVLACLSQEKTWYGLSSFEGVQYCQGVLVQVATVEKKVWRQVML